MEEEGFYLSDAQARQQIVDEQWRKLARLTFEVDRVERTERWVIPGLGVGVALSAMAATVSNWPTSLPFVACLAWGVYMLGGIVAERREREAKLKQAEKNYDLLCMEVHFLNSPNE